MGTEKTSGEKIIIALAIFAFYTFDYACAQKMRLEDLKAITLEKNKMAASRRYSQPIPQLVCTGGGAGCNSYTPKVVRCINEGWDGISVQWECKADMPEKYSFGTISVVCEGYDYPEDVFILTGSCSLEYTLEYSESNYQSKGKSSYYKASNQKHDGSGSTVIYIVIALVVFGYFIYSKFLSGDIASRTSERPGGPDIGWNVPNAHYKESTYGGFDPPPPYSSSESAYNQYGHRGYRTNQGLGGGGGFWTGLGTGGFLGYLFGSQRNPAPSAPRASSYSSGSFYQGDDSKGDGSSTMRTATAYGGTKKR